VNLGIRMETLNANGQHSALRAQLIVAVCPEVGPTTSHSGASPCLTLFPGQWNSFGRYEMVESSARVVKAKRCDTRTAQSQGNAPTRDAIISSRGAYPLFPPPSGSAQTLGTPRKLASIRPCRRRE